MNTQLVNSFNKLENSLKLRNYSNRTIEIYMHYIKEFISKCGKSPSLVMPIDIEKYIMSYRFSSISQQNQVYSALKVFGKYKQNPISIKKCIPERPRKKETLPNIIPEEFLKEKLSNISNLKHKAILSLAYSLALRRSDIQNLKIDCIDSKSMNIKIIEGKGNKDAYLPLTENLLQLLRKYYKNYKPKEYLFEGQKDNLYSGTSLNNIVKKYFGKQYHFHNIRHSTATHLLNKGVDISFIQKLLRHKDVKTTLIYLKITTRDLQNLPLY